MNIIDVPKVFKQERSWKFPPHHTGIHLEQYADEFFKNNLSNRNDEYTGGREYLPIYYSSWYFNHCGDNKSYNYDGRLLDVLMDYILSLPRDKKYFTVCQLSKTGWLEQALNEINCLTFGAGGWGDVAIPLPCEEHNRMRVNNPHFFASFVGSFDTHPIRKKMFETLAGESGIYMIDGRHNVDVFEHIMADSKFALCPRGYGLTSFRLYEAIQMGVVPVYISDEVWWLPFRDKIDWSKLAVLWHTNFMGELVKCLKTFDDAKIEEMAKYGQECYQKYFTMFGICDEIINILKEQT